jgi:enamine deaminase RidA (YjgF/YER057c/UK114 family)
MDKVSLTVSSIANRSRASTNSKWEPIIGYSRAVRAGNIIAVTGTLGINSDGSFPKTAAEQARRALQIIQAAIESLGGKLEDVIRTRMFVTAISQWEQIGKVHGEVFAEIRPATTMVQVARLIDDAALIEIEADAIVD